MVIPRPLAKAHGFASGSLPLIIRRLNSNHYPPLVPLRRDGHAATQLHRSAQQAVGRMALDLFSGSFGVISRGGIHCKSFCSTVVGQWIRDGRTIGWGRVAGVGNLLL
jgi:hypothetical protein